MQESLKQKPSGYTSVLHHGSNSGNKITPKKEKPPKVQASDATATNNQTVKAYRLELLL